MLGGVVLDLVEGGERGLNAAGCFIGERGQVCCRAGSLDEDLDAGVPAGPGGPYGRRDADGGDELPVAVAADGAEPGVLDAGLRPARVLWLSLSECHGGRGGLLLDPGAEVLAAIARVGGYT